MKVFKTLGLLTLATTTFCLAAHAQSAAVKDSVVRHFVAFKFKASTTSAQKQEIDKALMALKDKIAVVQSLEHGYNCSNENLNQGIDDGFILTFKNLHDRDIYLVHKEHEKFKAMALPKVEKAFVFDMTTEHQ